jgi:hypothetical protein
MAISYFQRDPATGEATGWLVEVPVLMKVMTAAAPISPDYIAQAQSRQCGNASAPSWFRPAFSS